jgi:tetratricopeptide (TPR) repeat protein
MQTNKEILIDYLDHQLNQQDADQVENMLQNDKSLADELEYLKMAVDTVRLNTIHDKVLAIRRSITNAPLLAEKPANTVIRSMYKMSLRVAAILILLIGMAVMYKYLTVSNKTIYEKQFTSYELSNLRGQESHDAEAEAYINKNWSEVIMVFQKDNNKSNKSIFLAAMAEMQLNNFSQAVKLFETILNPDRNTGDDSFREESEYYLSLAYLMNHETNKGIRLINKIKADSNHTYFPLAVKLSSIDLKIIELKK